MTDANVAQNRARPRQSPSVRRSIVDELTNPDSDTIRESLTRKCDLCLAPKGQLCVKRGGFTADLTGRLIHLGRMQDAR